MIYSFSNFIYSENKENFVVQSINGVTVVSDKSLQSLIRYVDSKNLCEFDEQLILKFFEVSEVDDVINFLLENSLIKIKDDIDGNFENLAFYTTDETLIELLKFINISKFKVVSNLENIENYNSVVVFMNKLSNIEYENIVNDLISKNIPFLISFFYNSSFYITNLFKKSWYNPCPKCFYANLQASLRCYDKMSNSISFQTVVDILFSKSSEFVLNTPINKEYYIHYLSEILKILNRDFQQNSKRIVQIGLNGETHYDVPIHFELCDCFES